MKRQKQQLSPSPCGYTHACVKKSHYSEICLIARSRKRWDNVRTISVNGEQANKGSWMRRQMELSLNPSVHLTPWSRAGGENHLSNITQTVGDRQNDQKHNSWLWSDATNNHSIIIIIIVYRPFIMVWNWLHEIEHNMCGRRAAWSPLWLVMTLFFVEYGSLCLWRRSLWHSGHLRSFVRRRLSANTRLSGWPRASPTT